MIETSVSLCSYFVQQTFILQLFYFLLCSRTQYDATYLNLMEKFIAIGDIHTHLNSEYKAQRRCSVFFYLEILVNVCVCDTLGSPI